VLVVIAEPSALLAVLVVGFVYARGVRTVWARAGRGHGIRAWQATAFGSGLLVVVLALESPLDPLSADLFAVHMVQHLLLILVAAPLLVLAAPLAGVLWGLPPDVRQGTLVLGRRLPAWVSRPAIAVALHVLAVWAWHLPGLYDAAVANAWVHAAEHACFVGSAALFWWALLHRRRAYGAAVLYVFAMAIQSTALGALLTFARSPWYTSHLATTAAWGLTALEDQQVAGLIMWVPGGLFYLAAALGLFGMWLKTDDAPGPALHTPARQ
jgi:cytochrome c oxidase assembly factor CtaG